MLPDHFPQRLATLPLFQGMSRDDLEHVASHTPFFFARYNKNKPLIQDGDACQRLHFLIRGSLVATHYSDNHTYSLSETVNAPEVLQIEHLFGLHQHYSRSFFTRTDCMLVSLDKADVVRLADEYLIFRLNLLNMLSTRCQRVARNPWHARPADRRALIVQFIEERCLRPAGEKWLAIKMERLAAELNDSRRHISATLRSMERDGLIILRRGLIRVPAMELLYFQRVTK